MRGVPTVANLKCLRDVNLSHNRLTSFPAQLCKLKKLDSLNLSSNKIKVLPSDVKFLQVLELNLNVNQVKTETKSVVNRFEGCLFEYRSPSCQTR